MVLTLSVDEEPEKARAYAQAHGFSFPVLLAHDYVRGTLNVRGIPRNWVLDRQLVWRTDDVGFSGEDGWLDAMTEAIASARSGGGVAAAR